MMYEILIVDDSVLDIDCITFLIKKHALPLGITTAANGLEALRLMKTADKYYDILFTDIKMPLMDGLELSQEARKLSPQTKIIIFSGYNDFEYAKTAITLGVHNYLLKPIVPADFVATINKLIHTLEGERRQEERMQKYSTLVKDHLLWLVTNTAELWPDYTDMLENYSHLMLLEFNNEFFNGDGLDFQSHLEEFLPFPCDYLNLYPTRSLLFIRSGSAGRNQEEAPLLSIAHSIGKLARERYHQKCYITFDALGDLYSIHRVYQNLENKMERRFFFPDQEVFLPDYPGQPLTSPEYISIDLLSDDIRLQDYHSLELHLQEIFDYLKNHNIHSLIYVKYCFVEIMKKILNALPSASRPGINTLVEQVYSSVNIQELISMTLKLSRQLSEEAQEDKNTVKIERIKQYIYQNYSTPLSLEEISSFFYISPNYLCSVFKKETGCNLIKFINDYRLKCARNLLISTEMKIHMIAEAVGFKNTSYFCQCFRNCYGKSPENFRLEEAQA